MAEGSASRTEEVWRRSTSRKTDYESLGLCSCQERLSFRKGESEALCRCILIFLKQRLQGFLFDIIMQDAKDKAVLVFCSTRKGAQEAATTVARAASSMNFRNPFIKSQEHYERLQLAARSSKDKHLQECIRCGVGFHNGGMDMIERSLVENLFLRGDIHILCTTNTLAHGVNLPAHTVIIKSTQYFNKDKGCYTEYERSTLVQMCGRAGRPQFDDNGLVIIMTRRDTVHLYENLLSGSEVVESELLPAIAEHLNAEIVLMTVSDVSLAIEWLKASFLYVRIKKNPQHYKVDRAREDHLENHLKEICLRNVNELAEFRLVETDEYGFQLKPLEPGRLMAKYYLDFSTMKEITKAPIKCAVEDMIYTLAKSQELSWIQLRRNEKKLLNDINGDTTGKIKYHVLGVNGKIKKRIQSREEKIFLLINDALSGDPSTLDFTMSQDVTAICTNGTRISRCMSEYFRFMKRFKETVTALKLAKCIHERLWEDSSYQLKQLAGVGMVTAKAFLQSGIDSFDKLAKADPRKLEAITGRKYPFGNQVKEALDKLPPRIDMKLIETRRNTSGNHELTLILTRPGKTTASMCNVAHLVVGSEKTNRLYYYERIRVEQFSRLLCFADLKLS
ncbi:ATP-dependent DNA helicase MER3 homolog [Selaginella moellendorffii]|uniref:ATP-dependent DNA helicase MER3 homolog n=1 Tax=Selaginella moellendorffii TaxID=88036 RepID=UPI000D1C2419|nr:ATP-dependent DNA helicase MER3 homolog [Selaginella moellendorffii]|eukprot:XP_024533051.1 ATP-dependent DNA helicase MER3 homolog [Selaginella moellendorffii]